MRALMLAVALLLCAPAGAAPRAKPAVKEQAERAFERGQKAYLEGRYQEAVQAFSEVLRLVPPHPSVLFNLARSQESLGNVGEAVASYEQALRLTQDETERKDLGQRIARLRATPVKVFISSQPSGARVTVDGSARPAPQVTPLVVKLKPGEHVLLVEHPGFLLATRRVVVEVEKELPVEVKLQPVPKPCPPLPPPCPPPPTCPSCRLVEFDQLHLHLALMGSLAATAKRPMAGGPSIQALASYRRWIFGGHASFFPYDDVKPPAGSLYTAIQPRWIMAQVEFGRVFPFKSFFTYATLGIGVSADRIVFKSEQKEDEINERFGFVCSAGGGIEAMATRWLSFGAVLRLGMIHGDRANRQDPRLPASGHYPYGSISGIASFHL
jgi:hypothetical protein